jgi:hypothetical protein
LPDETEGGAAYKKSRGYELACDLSLQHARKQLHTADLNTAVAEVTAVAKEVIESLFAADKHTKAIELNVDLMDAVLQQVTNNETACDELLRTAHEIAGHALERSLAEEESTGGARGRRNGAEAEEASEVGRVSALALEFLSNVSERMRVVRRRLSGLERADNPSAKLRCLAKIAEEAAAANVWPLAAYALEDGSSLLQKHGSPDGEAWSRRARSVWDRAAAESEASGLALLAKRYRQRVAPRTA